MKFRAFNFQVEWSDVRPSIEKIQVSTVVVSLVCEKGVEGAVRMRKKWEGWMDCERPLGKLTKGIFS